MNFLSLRPLVGDIALYVDCPDTTQTRSFLGIALRSPVPIVDLSHFFTAEIAFLTGLGLFTTRQAAQIKVQPQIPAPIVMLNVTARLPDFAYRYL